MKVDSRSKLIEATRELLWERGYSSTSPKDIQARAGLGQGSMYHHFAGKPELAAVALEQSGKTLILTAAESFDKDAPVFDRIVDYLRRSRPVLRGCPVGRMTEDADAMACDALRAPVEQTFSQLSARLTELIHEGQETGELVATVSPRLLACTIIATLQGGYVLAKAANDEQPFTDAIEGLLGVLASQVSSVPRDHHEG